MGRSKEKPRKSLSREIDEELNPVANKKYARKTANVVVDDEDTEMISEKLRQKILETAKEQQEELNPDSQPTLSRGLNVHEAFSDEEGMNSEAEEAYYRHEAVGEEDAATLAAFFDDEDVFSGEQTEEPAANTMWARIQEQLNAEEYKLDIPPKVEEAYRIIGQLMAKYKSGKLPKAFMAIPRFENWEDILAITEPWNWTPHAFFRAIRSYVGLMTDNMCSIFYGEYLLPACRVNMANNPNKKLSYHFYQALRKSVFRPKAFFKGLLLPLITEEPTLKEAVVFGSILQRSSLPAHHSCTFMMKLMELEWTPIVAYFFDLVLEKKYAIPLQFLKHVIDYFLGFYDQDEKLPVVWHRGVHSLCANYCEHFTKENCKDIYRLVRKHTHHLITIDIRKELNKAYLHLTHGISLDE
ncbi:hypothetical protein PCE1_004077 [Barthelona sp. PCE]